MAEKPRNSGDPAARAASQAAPVRRRMPIEPPARSQGLATTGGGRSNQAFGDRGSAARRESLSPPVGTSLEEPLESGPSDNTHPIISGPRDTTAVEDLSKVVAEAARTGTAPPPQAPSGAAPRRLLEQDESGPMETRLLDLHDPAALGGILYSSSKEGRERSAPAQKSAACASEVGSAWSNPTFRVAVGAAGVALVLLVIGSKLHTFYTEKDRPSRVDLAYLYPYRELQALAPGRVIPRGRELEFTFESETPCPHGKSGCLLYSYAKDGFTGSMVVYRPGPDEEWQRIDEVQRGRPK